MDEQDGPLEQLPLVPAEKRCGVCGTPREGNRDCRHCANERAKRHYAANREAKLAYARGYYAEHRGQIADAKRQERQRLREDDPAAWHSMNRVHYQRHKEQSTERARAWCLAHPQRVAAYKRTYYLANREALIARSRAWYEAHPEEARARRQDYWQRRRESILARRKAQWAAASPEEKAAMRAYKRSYHQLHRDKHNAASRASRAAMTPHEREHYRRQQELWRRRNPDKIRAWGQRNRQANPDRYRMRTRLRRARLSANGGEFTLKEVYLLREVQRDRCAYCLGALGLSYHVDHMTAVTKGGRSSLENLCLACMSCNGRKFIRSSGQFFALLIKERRATVRGQLAV